MRINFKKLLFVCLLGSLFLFSFPDLIHAACRPGDLACGKPTSSSSSLWIYWPQRAVDGEDGYDCCGGDCSPWNQNAYTCFRSGEQFWGWWQVDLQSTYPVNVVRVLAGSYGSDGVWSSIFLDLYNSAGNHIYRQEVSGYGFPVNSWYNFNVPNISARYVRFTTTYFSQHWRSVEVYSCSTACGQAANAGCAATAACCSGVYASCSGWTPSCGPQTRTCYDTGCGTPQTQYQTGPACCTGSYGSCTGWSPSCGPQTRTCYDTGCGTAQVQNQNGPTCNVAPTINSVTINATTVVANNSNQYTISVTGSDGNGASDIYGLYGLINYQGETGGNYRGYLTWGLGDYWPSSQNHIACSGGGWAVVQSGYGNSYIQLKSCSISNSGNSRTANFVVTFDPSFTSPSDNDISGYVWDSQGAAHGWVNFQTNFNVCPATVPITGTITGIPSGNTSWAFAGTLQSNTINAPSGTYTVNAPVFGSYQVFAKAISGYSYTPGLTTVATPTACATVTGPTLTYAQNACPQQPDNNLKAVWHMDETSGQSAPDSSGNSYNGTATGSTIVTGKFGSGRNFSAIGDVLSLSSAFPLGPNYTIGAWFNYPFPTTTGGWNTLTRGTASDHQVIVQRSNMEIGVYDNAGGTGFHGSGFITNTLSNGWHYLTAVGTGSTTTFYIDGVQKGISNVKSTSNIGYIGNYQGGGQQFGSVDEIRIWNRALTATEIGAESQQLCPTGVKANCAPLSTCQNPRGTTILCGTGLKYRTCYDSGNSSPIDDDAQACIVQPSQIITGQIMNAPQTVSITGNRTNTPTGGSCPNSISTTASQTSYSFTAPAMCSYNLNLQTLSGYDTSPKDYPVTIGCSDSSGPTFWYLSSAGAVSSVSTIDPGAGKISQGGYTPGYRLTNYINSYNASNVNYSRLLNTVLKNSGLNTPTNLDSDPNCSGGGVISSGNYNIYCYNTGTFDSKLTTAIADGSASKTMVLYPAGNANLAQTLNTAKTISSNGKMVIVFVNGNLTVNNPISIPAAYTGSGIVFVVNGNITLDPAISTFDGFYIFSGSFDDGNSVNVLTGRGSLLGTGTGNIVFNRSTTAQTIPAEQWIYQPKYLTLFAQSLATPKYTWQELSPQ